MVPSSTLALALVAALGGQVAQASSAAAPDRQLKGRFIHITDIHPDPYYTPGSRVGEACHTKPASPGLLRARSEDGGEVGMEGVDENDPRKAGKWGTGPSDCDTPLSLVNITFDWLEANWADEVDFVIWTGDNARHDISRALPRTPAEIYDLNRMVVRRMHDVFGSRGVKVVPSLGNNDIWPHNIMYPGPNDITETFLDIWSAHIPSEQTHVFERGAYFTSEVIPDRLAVVSLNTLFWYDSNKAVDGCPFDGSEPGSEQIEWLEVQLSIFRARSMQVWLSGHVPPSPGNYFPDCWFRFGELLLAFQDTVVGSLFGHMNVDHWFLMEADALEQWRLNPGASFGPQTADAASSSNATAGHALASSLLPSYASLSSSARLPGTGLSRSFTPADDGNLPSGVEPASCPSDADANLSILKSRTKSGTLEGDLQRACERLPKRSKTDLGAFGIVNVGASIIPTYFPSVRVYTYNATGEPFRQNQTLGTEAAFSAFEEDGLLSQDALSADVLEEHDDDDDDDDDDPTDLEALKKNKKKHRKPKGPHRPGDAYCRRHKHAFEPVCQRRKPMYVDAASPSRSNGFATPLGYSQWYLPDVNNEKRQPEYKLEYATYEPKALIPMPRPHVTDDGAQALPSNASQALPPIPLHLLPAALLSPPPTSRSRSNPLLPAAAAAAAESFTDAVRKYTPYRLKDLTVPSYLRLGRKLAQDKALWKTFLHHMFVSTGREKDD